MLDASMKDSKFYTRANNRMSLCCRVSSIRLRSPTGGSLQRVGSRFDLYSCDGGGPTCCAYCGKNQRYIHQGNLRVVVHFKGTGSGGGSPLASHVEDCNNCFTYRLNFMIQKYVTRVDTLAIASLTFSSFVLPEQCIFLHTCDTTVEITIACAVPEADSA